MTDTPSIVLTVANRSFEGVDVEALASALNLGVRRLDSTDIAAILNSSADASAELFVGSGNLHRDAEIAAALGAGLIIVTPEDTVGDAVALAVEESEALQATVLGTATGSGLVDKAPEFKAALESAAAELAPVMSAPVFEHQLLAQAKAAGSHIVLPEGDDDRILQAAHQLLADDVVKLTILGEPESINARAAELGLDLSKATIINHLDSKYTEEFAADFAELRKKKGVTIEQARETMQDISYFGTMMVHKGIADGMVSGAAHTTAHTIKPSFQIIKTAPGSSVVSSIFLMVMPGRLWAFGDCAVNPNPTAEQLGEIAAVSAKTASQFGIDPRVAMLSYSTGTSGTGPDVDRAVAALAKARELDPELKVDGPLQFDAAVDAGVAAKKMPESEVAGQATVFIFPDLEAGNIGYKTAQRTGGALAVGPILQGLNKPVNDLSRGATIADIVNTVAITAIQAGGVS
ncbi:phosphate acetyltransferase [Corynebacterium incognita]|uniref:Phosphate acetyltransferase n=1 Tax=Corynebacterium incognita TaxID=2754725 RepID=A0A7G7CRJ0_9CORY|nr:phosphate acetyltransferase [Corynebacterium incognita]QNE90206.1 phosphate acetyltransferase [Corynebacterium incognita]